MIDYEANNWYSHLLDVRGSMVREIWLRVAGCAIWSAVVVVLYSIGLKWIAIPNVVHGFVGVALSVLLVFRTNASYDRFWEGRKLWGNITNESRNLGRIASVLLKTEHALLSKVVTWAQVLPYAILAKLRSESDLGPPAAKLPKPEIEAVRRSKHAALAVATNITKLLKQTKEQSIVSDYEFTYMDNNVQLLIDYCGGCERIRNTPLPYPYMIHLRRVLILYCTTLPFALVKDFGASTILATLMVAYVFFGIEEIGVEIEDPFGCDDNDMPLASFCHGIEVVLEDHLRMQQEAPESREADESEPVEEPPHGSIPLDV